MRVLIDLNHPAHYHFLKNTIKKMITNGIECIIVAQTKDVLTDLLDEDNIKYINKKPKRRKKNSFFILLYELILQDAIMLKIVLRKKPDLMIGTSYSITHIGKLLKIPSFVVNEDDADVVPLFAKLSYPFATGVISPDVCSVGKWENKKISYEGYHELAYLHPNNFTPDKRIVEKYIDNVDDYFILRFAKLSAHHDKGIQGITDEIALGIVHYLSDFGKVLITSEREFDSELEKYRMNINPKDIHHFLAFAKLYIGDSQTMSAEAGVLGTPFIRFNDFVGKIGYLNDLEMKYELGYGFKTNQLDKMLSKIEKLVKLVNIKQIWEEKRNNMLNHKVDVNKFLYNFIREYKQKKLSL
jgi:predicted glycosyltransferase